MIYRLAHTAIASMLPYTTFSSVYVSIYLFLRLINKTNKAMGELDDLLSRKCCQLGKKIYSEMGGKKSIHLNLPDSSLQN